MTNRCGKMKSGMVNWCDKMKGGMTNREVTGVER